MYLDSYQSKKNIKKKFDRSIFLTDLRYIDSVDVLNVLDVLVLFLVGGVAHDCVVAVRENIGHLD